MSARGKTGSVNPRSPIAEKKKAGTFQPRLTQKEFN